MLLRPLGTAVRQHANIHGRGHRIDLRFRQNPCREQESRLGAHRGSLILEDLHTFSIGPIAEDVAHVIESGTWDDPCVSNDVQEPLRKGQYGCTGDHRPFTG